MDRFENQPDAPSSSNKKRLRVCVIGAGAAGLCAARHLAANLNEFEFAVYERSSEIGGTWVYTDKTGLDDDGHPIHSSMYRDLRTNLPKEIMCFPDYRKVEGGDDSCVSHQAILDYLKEYAKYFQLNQFIRIGTVVESVEPIDPDNANVRGKWKVRAKNVGSREDEELIYDAVMSCNGHFFDPYVPKIPGLDDFQGLVMHSHNYREPESFTGKTIILLGAASSGIDMALELSKKARRVYLSHYHDRLNMKSSSNLVETEGIDKFENGAFHLRDGTCVEAVDVLIFCTGYRYSYPFLRKSCGIKVTDNQVTPLYKHLINVEYPSMCLIGVPMLVIPFPMFHMQVQYFLNLLLGKFSFPSKPEMLSKTELLPTPTERRHAHKLGEGQWAYNDQLAFEGNFEPLPSFYKIGYEAWVKMRRDRLADYKRFRLRITDDDRRIRIEEPPELVT